MKQLKQRKIYLIYQTFIYFLTAIFKLNRHDANLRTPRNRNVNGYLSRGANTNNFNVSYQNVGESECYPEE